MFLLWRFNKNIAKLLKWILKLKLYQYNVNLKCYIYSPETKLQMKLNLAVIATENVAYVHVTLKQDPPILRNAAKLGFQNIFACKQIKVLRKLGKIQHWLYLLCSRRKQTPENTQILFTLHLSFDEEIKDLIYTCCRFKIWNNS